MAETYDSKAAGSQDSLQAIGGGEAESGRKGGAVMAAPERAPYSEAGPSAARMFDATAAASEETPLRKLWPLLVMALIAMLVIGALFFRPRATTTQGGQPAVTGDSRAPGSANANGSR